MPEQFQKAIEDLTREEAQAELRRAWKMWREMDDLHDQACDWAVAANSLRGSAVTALEQAQEKLDAVRELHAFGCTIDQACLVSVDDVDRILKGE